jgi:hypothetical protein
MRLRTIPLAMGAMLKAKERKKKIVNIGVFKTF